MKDPILKAREVTVNFRDSNGVPFAAVRSASLTLNHGEAIGIVGESGSGKTTLANVLGGLQSLDDGEVELEGETVSHRGWRSTLPKRDRWKVQMVFQDPYSSLNPRMRAWQTVAEAYSVWEKLSRKKARQKALTLLQSLGISDEQASLFPRSLSGGQLQRVSVARALVPHPRVLIADEPTSAIDQSAQGQLLNLLRSLQLDHQLSIIFVSHDLGLVRYLTSRVSVLKDGVIVESGNTREVFANPADPYTRSLLAAMPRPATL